MTNWKKYKLGDLTDTIFSGGTPDTTNPKYWNGKFPWLSSGETRNSLIIKSDKTITQEGINNSSTRLALTNDVLIASAGQGFTRGQTSYCLIDTYINQSIISVRADNKRANSKFIFYNLTNRYEFLRQLSDGNSIRGSLTTKIMKDFEILLPPLPEQKAIASVLSSLDDKIELNRRQNETLEKIAKAIFKHWFVDFNFPDEKGKPYKDSGGEMVESELGLIPKGWRVGKLGNYCDVFRGSSPRPISDPRFFKDGTYPWVKIADATKSNSFFINETKEHCTEEALPHTRLLKKGSLLLSNSATVGVPMILNIDGCIHDGWLSFKNYNIISRNFIFFLFATKGNYFNAFADGTVQKNLNTTLLKELRIILPNKEFINKFDYISDSLLNKILINENENQILSQLRDELLPKLMSGKVRVKGV